MRKAFLRGLSTAAFVVGLGAACDSALAANVPILTDTNAITGSDYMIYPGRSNVTLRVGDGVNLTKSTTLAIDRGNSPTLNLGKAIVTFAGNSTVDGTVGETYKVDTILINGNASKTVKFTEDVAVGDITITGDGKVQLDKNLTGNITTADGRGTVILSSTSSGGIDGNIGTSSAALGLLWLDDSATAGSNAKTITGDAYIKTVKVDGTNPLLFSGSLSGKVSGGVTTGTDVEFTSGLNNGTLSVGGDAVLGAITTAHSGWGSVELGGVGDKIGSIGSSDKALGVLQAGRNGTTTEVKENAYVRDVRVAGGGLITFNGALSADLSGTSINFVSGSGTLAVNGNANLGNVITGTANSGNLILRGQTTALRRLELISILWDH